MVAGPVSASLRVPPLGGLHPVSVVSLRSLAALVHFSRPSPGPRRLMAAGPASASLYLRTGPLRDPAGTLPLGGLRPVSVVSLRSLAALVHFSRPSPGPRCLMAAGPASAPLYLRTGPLRDPAGTLPRGGLHPVSAARSLHSLALPPLSAPSPGPRRLMAAGPAAKFRAGGCRRRRRLRSGCCNRRRRLLA